MTTDDAQTEGGSEVLRHGLLAGVRTIADAVAGADGIVAADPKPDTAVIDVASSARRCTADVIALLRDVPGACDSVAVIRRALADLRTLAGSGTYGTSADALRNLDAYLERHAWRHEV